MHAVDWLNGDVDIKFGLQCHEVTARLFAHDWSVILGENLDHHLTGCFVDVRRVHSTNHIMRIGRPHLTTCYRVLIPRSTFSIANKHRQTDRAG